MPPPANQTALTAINVGASPVSYTQQVDDAGISYTVWLKHTIAIGVDVIGLWAHGQDLVNYLPRVKMYTGPASAPVLYNDFGVASQSKRLRISVTAGTEYFFEIITNAAVPSNLTFELENAPQGIHTAGDFFIPDDIDPNLFPAGVVSRVDGTIVRFVKGFASGEQGDILSDGYIIQTDLVSNTVKGYFNEFIFDNNIAGLSSFAIIRTNRVLDKFYVTEGFDLSSVDNAGNRTFLETISASNPPDSIATNNAGTILYHALDTVSGPIHAWQIGVGALPDLVAGLAGYKISDILNLTDDTLIVGYWDPNTNDYQIKRYDSAGVTLNTYPVGTIFVGDGVPRLGYGLEDNTFVAFYHTSIGIPVYRQYRASDGFILNQQGIVEYGGGVYSPPATLTPLAKFGASPSCPIMVLRTPVPATGTIIINKITNPSASAVVFIFNAGGGLSPNTFTLTDGQTRTYNNVPAGIYSIEEIVPPGWSVQYSVSDGSPVSALNLAAGETIVVNVTNTLAPNQRSGIYKIVPGKRNDTLWNDLSAETTTDVKIPNPRIRTGLFGE